MLIIIFITITIIYFFLNFSYHCFPTALSLSRCTPYIFFQFISFSFLFILSNVVYFLGVAYIHICHYCSSCFYCCILLTLNVLPRFISPCKFVVLILTPFSLLVPFVLDSLFPLPVSNPFQVLWFQSSIICQNCLPNSLRTITTGTA